MGSVENDSIIVGKTHLIHIRLGEFGQTGLMRRQTCDIYTINLCAVCGGVLSSILKWDVEIWVRVLAEGIHNSEGRNKRCESSSRDTGLNGNLSEKCPEVCTTGPLTVFLNESKNNDSSKLNINLNML